MRVLGIEQYMIDEPARVYMDLIGTEMLWPHDEAKRALGLKVACAEAFANILDLAGIAAEAEAIAALRKIPTLESLEEETATALRHGRIAGNLLWEALAGASIALSRSPLPTLKQQIAKSLLAEGIRTSVKNIDNVIWPRYRSVAHFWAAHEERRITGQGPHFPCVASALGEFLALAERFRQLGENLRLPHSPGPILRPGEAVRLPENLRLPEIRIQFVRKEPG